ncbi:hypothetical protein ABEF93_004385 [Exophiala dermatitidis]
MTELLDQAPEVLHNIFLHVESTDLASLSRTCRYLHKLIWDDELLWKSEYLSQFDPPTQEDSSTWRERVTRLVNIQKILESDNVGVKTAALEEVLTKAVDLAYQSDPTSSNNSDFLADLFQKPSNVNAFLCRSSLSARSRPNVWSAAPSETLRQLSAQLHVLGGMNLEPLWPIPEEMTCPRFVDEEGTVLDIPQPIRHVHPYARSRVYDLRRYTDGNMWGPFMDDGSQRVDWEKVQAIMIVIAYNHRLYTERRGLAGPLPAVLFAGIASSSSSSSAPSPPSSSSSSSSSPSTAAAAAGAVPSSSTSSTTRQRRRRTSPGLGGTGSILRPWEEPFSGIARDSYGSCSLTGTPLTSGLRPDLDALDPYGVTGTWMRIVCFLDYNDLYAFNFESGDIPEDQERDPITTREAFRLIRLQLRVKAIEHPGEEDGKDLPVVHFEGTSRSTFMAWDPNANSRIKGTVRQTPSGAIRWTSFSLFHGEERWRSEGVQIGGLRSARGILGNWFDKDYDLHGPAGPTAFWKISDDMVEDKRSPSQLVQIFLAE